MEKCQYCQQDFECSTKKKNWNTKMGYAIYCSHICYNKAKDKRVECLCANCGTIVYRTPKQIAISKTGNVYCSRSCSNGKNNTLFKSGENHPNYVDGKGTYRSRALKGKESRCEDCGLEDEIVLQVHHIDKNRKNNKLENLAVLCANCHVRRHKTRM